MHCEELRNLYSSPNIINRVTERRGQVVRTRISFSGGPGFKSCPGDWLSWLDFFVVFFSHPRQIPGHYLKLNHDRFLPHPVQFIVHKRPCNSTLHDISKNKLNYYGGQTRRMRCTRHVTCVFEIRHTYKITVGKSETKRPLRRPRAWREDNINTDFTEVGWEGEDWNNIVQDRVQWRDFVNTVMNLRAP
jgi:hypothetical protein